MNLRCPHCRNAFEIVADQSQEAVTCPSCHSKISVAELLTLHPSDSQAETAARSTVMPAAGETVAHFEIIELVGIGGFGSVYSAFDTRLQRNVALKIPRLEYVSKRQAEIFIHEARSAAQLRDPNIVSVHEIGRDDRFVYIVSDLIDGVTLKDWMVDCEPTERESAAIISRIAKAIHKAHDKGIIHRDLKPSNILVDPAGAPHITDFGLAKRENPEEISITVSGEVIGTPAYMSPEQAQGKAEQADKRTDVYSMGVMLYELLTQQRPFRGESDLLIEEVIAGDPVPPSKLKPSISADLEAICLKAMSRGVGNRFATALEFAEDLDRFVSGEPTLTRPPGPLEKLARTASRYRLAIGVCALVLALLSVSAYAYIVGSRPSATTGPSKLWVEFKTIPPRADVRIFQADFDRGRFLYESPLTPTAITRDGAELYEIELASGWYKIEAHIPGFGLQEVWRLVPEEVTDKKEKFRHSDWTRIDTTRISLTSIEIVPVPSAGDVILLQKERLVYRPGGTYTSGDNSARSPDGQLQFPLHQARLDPFYIGETEVVAEAFSDVMGYLPQGMLERFGASVPLDQPVTNVRFFEALDYCERIGTQLIEVEPFIYTATNGADVTPFPWGSDGTVIKEWSFGLARTPEYDATLLTPRVYNLYSSVVEWTQDLALAPVKISEVREAARLSRLVVGGEDPQQSGESKRPARLMGVRSRRWQPIYEPPQDGLGFRCMRRTLPRQFVSPKPL